MLAGRSGTSLTVSFLCIGMFKKLSMSILDSNFIVSRVLTSSGAASAARPREPYIAPRALNFPSRSPDGTNYLPPLGVAPGLGIRDRDRFERAD